MGFENTQYARDYFQVQIPKLLREVKRIADNQEKQIELQIKAQENKPTVTTVFVCYEENTDIGQTARLFVTVSKEEAREWGRKALAEAKKNDFFRSMTMMRTCFLLILSKIRERQSGYTRVKKKMLGRTTASASM